MKVKELIEILQGIDENITVAFIDSWRGETSDINKVEVWPSRGRCMISRDLQKVRDEVKARGGDGWFRKKW